MNNNIVKTNNGFTDMEDLCNYMIKNRFGKAKDLKSVDIEDFIINVLGYKILYESFTGPDSDVEGFTSDGKQTVYLSRKGIVELVLFPPGYIIIDKMFLQDKYEAKRRFVLAHEAGHVISDKLYQNGTVGYFRNPEDIGDEDYKKLASIMSYREFRANRCAAALLMPEFLFIEALKRNKIRRRIKLFGSGTLLPADRDKLMNIAREFNVSYKAVFNRFKDLDCFAKRDISEYWEIVNKENM